MARSSPVTRRTSRRVRSSRDGAAGVAVLVDERSALRSPPVNDNGSRYALRSSVTVPLSAGPLESMVQSSAAGLRAQPWRSNDELVVRNVRLPSIGVKDRCRIEPATSASPPFTVADRRWKVIVSPASVIVPVMSPTITRGSATRASPSLKVT